MINGFLSLALFLKCGPSFAYAVLFPFCSAMVVVTFIDLEHQIIPDSITLSGIVIGFAISFFIPNFGWLNTLIGILAGNRCGRRCGRAKLTASKYLNLDLRQLRRGGEKCI